METALIFPFAPAEGAILRFGIAPDDLSKGWFTDFGPRITALRNGSARNLGQAAMGIVSVPSFHAAAGIVLAWASRSLPFLGLMLIGVNLLMIISTPISGIHYLSDVLGGLVVGVAAVAVAECLTANR